MKATKPVISYLVEWEEGGSALHCWTNSASFEKRPEANKHFKAMRVKWIYVRLYRIQTIKTPLRIAHLSSPKEKP